VTTAKRVVVEVAGELGPDGLHPLQAAIAVAVEVEAAAVTVAKKAKAELEEVDAQEPKGKASRPVHRFLVQSDPHPRRKNHFNVRRHKWGVPALCGANPPK
jgi:hypothetical protein